MAILHLHFFHYLTFILSLSTMHLDFHPSLQPLFHAYPFFYPTYVTTFMKPYITISHVHDSPMHAPPNTYSHTHRIYLTPHPSPFPYPPYAYILIPCHSIFNLHTHLYSRPNYLHIHIIIFFLNALIPVSLTLLTHHTHYLTTFPSNLHASSNPPPFPFLSPNIHYIHGSHSLHHQVILSHSNSLPFPPMRMQPVCMLVLHLDIFNTWWRHVGERIMKDISGYICCKLRFWHGCKEDQRNFLRTSSKFLEVWC